MGIKVHKIAVNEFTRQIDVKHVKRAINCNTIMLHVVVLVHDHVTLT